MNGGDGNPYNRGAKPVLNNHPTVKSVALCSWLTRLVCPPGGTILDPFAGSGSIGVAAILEGFDYIGIELDEHFVDIARRRLAWAEKHPEVFAPKKQKASRPKPVVSNADPAPAVAKLSVVEEPKAVRKGRADDQQEFPW
jgi:DNA modification methylase